MFKEFKKDKITKLIHKEKDTVYNKLKNNDINLLEAHFILENKISQIYSENEFCYQDLLNRKKFLTSFRSNTKNIMISLLFGILGSVICSVISDISKILFDFGPIMNCISMIIIVLLIVFFVIESIVKNAKILSDNDLYNVDSYELDIIKEALQTFENKKLEL